MSMNIILKKIASNIKKNKDKGQVTLFIAVSMTIFILYIGLYTINKNINEQKALINATNSMGSFYAADIGTERFLLELNNRIASSTYVSIDDTIAGAGIDSAVSLGDGRSFVVDLSGPNQVKTVGSYKNTNRAIELSYSP
jgi:hypothetical protein